MTENTELVLIETALAEFDKVSAGLAQLNKNYAGVLYDVERPEGMNVAKAARKLLREKRTGVERVRTEAKAPLLAIGRRLDAEAKRITAELEKLEDPIALQIETEEKRTEREAAEKLAAETRRVEQLQMRINGIRRMALIPANSPAADFKARHDEVKALVIADYQELTDEAQSAKDQTAAILFGLHASAVAAEAEAVRAAAEREELARLRAENEQRAKLDAERLAAERAEAERIAKIERDKQAEEMRIKQAELDRQKAEQEAALKTERDRIAAEAAKAKAEADRVEAEARKAREAAAAELAEKQRVFAAEQEAARVAAQREYTASQDKQRGQIVTLVAEHYSMTADEAEELLHGLFA